MGTRGTSTLHQGDVWLFPMNGRGTDLITMSALPVQEATCTRLQSFLQALTVVGRNSGGVYLEF